MPPDEIPLTIRLPARLHAQVAALAERERRSRNAQIVLLLEEAIRKR